MKELSPILLFVYNRPHHTQQTIDALKKNLLAEDSILYVYSDAAKSPTSNEQVQNVRTILKNISGFKRVVIHERTKNLGLAQSIIQGVSEVIARHKKAIVLEDDMITSPYFLNYMNDALERYRDEKKVWHVSAWNYPITKEDTNQTFFTPIMNCWGWATWEDRWVFYEKNTEALLNKFSKKEIKRFNVDNHHNFWQQVLDNATGKINTWAIYWYATIFKNNGLCIAPVKTLVINTGNDGSGENCKSDNVFGNEINSSKNFVFPNKVVVEIQKLSEIKKFMHSLKVSLPKRVFYKLKKIFD